MLKDPKDHGAAAVDLPVDPSLTASSSQGVRESRQQIPQGHPNIECAFRSDRIGCQTARRD